jgi:RimJ/RimL family protein N-acetyltransferase
LLHRLDKGSYNRARSLFGAMQHHMAVDAVLDGAFDAPVYVDDLQKPGLAVTWTTHRVYLVGESKGDMLNRALCQLFAEVYCPQAIAAGRGEFGFYYAPDHWETQIDVLWKDKNPMRGRQLFFTFKAPRQDWHPLLPEGFVLREVDAQLIADETLEGHEELLEELVSERQSVADFLNKSFGLCLIHDHKLVGWCLSEYNSANQCEVGIAVAGPYQRRGLGTLLASAFAEQALARHVTRIGWHCWANNYSSSALARKAGFEQVHDYPVYFALFNPTLNLLVNGNVRFDQQHYEEALHWYKRGLAAGDVPCWGYYRAAQAYAKLDQPDEAMRCLNAAIDGGWTALDEVLQCEAFQPLHGSPAWESAISRLGAAAHG